MSDKASLRQQLLAARQAMPDSQRAEADAAIGARVLALLEAAPAIVLGIYWPMRGEPDLRPAYDALQLRGQRLALPVVDGAQQPLRFVSWAPGEPLARDALGVMVPVEGRTVVPDVLLVPCVGFNAERLRLGYGGGYYDRTLATQPRPRSIGVAHALAACAFAGDAHDVPLDQVITESSTQVLDHK